MSSILIEILNLERAVRPPGNIDAAIPDVAVAMAINPFGPHSSKKALYRNVLPVPPGPSKKNLAFVGEERDNGYLAQGTDPFKQFAY